MGGLTTLLAPFFMNPALAAGGAALVASPIIIHLINRMRFRRVRFAAMEFLLASQKRNRRRLLLEQLLLLLLRILLVIGLVALLARLILDPSQLSMLTNTKAHHLVLLDDSGSMLDRRGEKTVFEDALEVVRKLVDEGARRPETQKLTLVLLSDPERPLYSEAPIDESLLKSLGTKFENLKCTHRALSLAEGLAGAQKLLAEDPASIKYLHVVSDFRDRDWKGDSAIGPLVEKIDGEGVAVNLVKTVREFADGAAASDANLAVTGLDGDVQVAAAEVPLRLTVRVRNHGANAARNVRLTTRIDGEKIPMSLGFDVIEPGAEVARDFDVTFETARKHKVEVALEADRLAGDNARFLAVDVPVTNPLLIVDGSPSADAGRFLQWALSPESKSTSLSPVLESVEYLRRHPLGSFQCIFLINVAELPADAIDALERYVRDGGGLAWFAGDQVQAAHYNEHLWKNGEGLFPVPLAAARRELLRDPTASPGADLTFAEHPVFAIFEGQDNPFVESVTISKHLAAADEWNRNDNVRKDGVRTIATLRTKQPLMFERTFGAGRIFASLTTAGPDWTDWPRNPSYVIFALELEKYLARRDRTQERRLVGEPIRIDLDPSQYLENVEVSVPTPEGDRKYSVTATIRVSGEENPDGDAKAAPAGKGDKVDAPDRVDTPDKGEARLKADFADTAAPGVYVVTTHAQNGTPEEEWIAYNVPEEESELGVASSDAIRKRLGEKVRVEIQEPGQLEWIRGKDANQEVRELLLIVLIVVLLAEQFMAYRLSYHPSTASLEPAATPRTTRRTREVAA